MHNCNPHTCRKWSAPVYHSGIAVILRVQHKCCRIVWFWKASGEQPQNNIIVQIDIKITNDLSIHCHAAIIASNITTALNYLLTWGEQYTLWHILLRIIYERRFLVWPIQTAYSHFTAISSLKYRYQVGFSMGFQQKHNNRGLGMHRISWPLRD